MTSRKQRKQDLKELDTVINYAKWLSKSAATLAGTYHQRELANGEEIDTAVHDILAEGVARAKALTDDLERTLTIVRSHLKETKTGFKLW